MRAGQAMCVVGLALTVIASAPGQSHREPDGETTEQYVKRMESYTHVPADVKAFAAEYVAAWNAKDQGRLMSLGGAQSRACITPENKAVYDELMRAQWRHPITPGYMLMLMPVNEGNLKALAADAYFPVKPERELHIDWQYANSNDSDGVVLWLVQQNGRWIADFPCMTAHGIQEYRDDAADREKYKKMAAGIKEPLRGELLGMLRKHQMGEAEERYKAATGCDMKTAMLVVNALDGNMP